MEKILIITDSLGAPRSYPEKVSDSDVWTYRLADELKENYIFRFFIINGLDTNLLINYCHSHLLAYEPDIVILQIGIVDCCPRSLTKKELLISKNLPRSISNVIHKLVKKYRKNLIQYRKIRYTDPEIFRSNLLVLKELYCKATFKVIPIAPPTKDYLESTPLLEMSINNYNNILSSIFEEGFLADCYNGIDTSLLFLSDHHHLAAFGHSIVYKQVCNALNILPHR